MTAYKTADMKEKVRQLATGDNEAHGALRKAVTSPTQTPQGTAIDDIVNKDDIKYYFDNLDAAATNEKVVLDQLTSAILTLTTNNEALVATNAKLAEEVTTLTRNLGRNTGGDTSGTAAGKVEQGNAHTVRKKAPTNQIPA